MLSGELRELRGVTGTATTANLSLSNCGSRSPYLALLGVLTHHVDNMAAHTPTSPEDYSLFLSENGHLSFENPNYQAGINTS